jgi:hypothetical protein
LFVHAMVPIEHQTTRPQLRPLELLDQLKAVLGPTRWRCQLSEKGRFAEGAAERFGGFPELCAALRRPDVARIICAYQDAGDDATGLALRDRRRYPSLRDIEQLDLAANPEQLVASLETDRVLIRGMVLKCPRCRHADFHRPGETDPEFTCRRCGERSRPNRDAWLGTPEPVWHYRLDEVVFQFVRHRGDLPALAVFDRFGRSRHPVRAVAELEFTDPQGARSELDFAVLEGPDLWLGEAFTGARYENTRNKEAERLNRLREIAGLVNARGVILATAEPALDMRTIEVAQEKFPGPWPQLELRTGVFALDRPVRSIDAAPD